MDDIDQVYDMYIFYRDKAEELKKQANMLSVIGE